MAKINPARSRQYVWMKWYLGGCISVLLIIQRMWGVNTGQARSAIADVSRRLSARYISARRATK